MKTMPTSYHQEILNGLYNYVPILVLRVDIKGRVLEVHGSNKYSEQETFDFQKVNLYEAFPNLQDDLFPIFEFNQHTKFKSKIALNERMIYWDNYAFPISDSENDEKQAIIISLDITDDIDARDSLNQKNNELKAIFDAIPDLYFRLDNQGLILDYKSAITSDMYVPSEIFLNKKIETFLPSKLNIKINECFQIVNQKKKLVTMEYELEFANLIRHFEARFFPLFDDQIILIIREITEKVKIQNSIIEKEKLLLETQKIAKVYSFFWDIVENKVTYTDEFYNIAEVKESEIDQNPISLLKVIHPDDHEMVLAEIEKALQSLDNLYLEFRLLMPDKRVKYIMSKGKIKRDSSGKPLQMLGLNQDITLRKQNEMELLTQKSELQRLLNNIEGIVASQTNELRISKEKAEKANQAKSYFLANVSHELKTPIHAIMSFAELGKERIIQKDMIKIQEYFEIILESGERLYNLMSNILDLSKLESGNENFQFSNSSLCSVCKEVASEMNAILDQKRIQLEFQHPSFSTDLLFDRFKIAQVIRNILANSIRFSSEGSRIEIEFISGEFHRNEKDRFQGIGFLIRDFGQGIQQEEKELIFEKFRQGKNVKLGTGGTGLGLSISREIIQNHNGLIFAKNHALGGAEFYVILPKDAKENLVKIPNNGHHV